MKKNDNKYSNEKVVKIQKVWKGHKARKNYE